MNRSHAIPLASVALVFAALLGACGTSGDSNAKATTTAAAQETTTTAEATTTSEATTTTEASKFPTYDAYIAALPSGTEQCDTKGTVTGGDGQYGIGGEDSTIAMVNGEMTIFCPGAQLTVGDPFTGVNQYGDPLAMGDFFSVAADGSLVQLSSF